MKRAFLYIVAVMLYCNPVWADEPDPNLIWVSDPSWVDGFHRFLVHPNGNILAGIGSTEFELDGNTGLIIREFPYPAVFYDISPDGKYISALTDQRCVIDYETEEVTARFTNSNTSPKFMPDSKTLIYDVLNEAGKDFNTKLATYNIETGGYRFSTNPLVQTSVWHINVSPDGRFVATGGKFIDINDNEYTRLVLWDAQILAPIKILSENKGFREIRSIKFSLDSRLVGFVVYLNDLYIYKTDDYSLYKHYGEHNTEYGIGGFCYINENLIANKYGPLTYILNSFNDTVLFKTGIHGGTEYSIIEKNISNNSMITGTGKLIAWDLIKIITGASLEPEVANPFIVEYMNNTLLIKNYNFTSVQITAQIADINGKIIRQIELITSTGELRIPIKLISGTYFLHIKDGSKEYVSKFLVTN
jgi:hypothetical protein